MRKYFHLVLILLLFSTTARAGYEIKFDNEVTIEAGGRIVVQYQQFDVEIEGAGDLNDDELIFRRLRPYLKLKYKDNWQVKLAWEIGEGRNSIKDAYVRYRGIDWLDIKLGNETLPFSRERMTSSAKQQSPERTLVGDTEFGVPGRQLGIHLKTGFAAPFSFYLSFAKANIHGDLLTEIQFISPLSNSRIADSLQDEGSIMVARVDYKLWGGTKYRQGNLKDNTGLTLSVAVYDWDNQHTVVEINHAEGIEVSVAYRGAGLSIDAEYNELSAESPFLLDRPLFDMGKAGLQQSSIEAGYLIFKNQLELVASIQAMQADNWSRDWGIWEVGANYFFSGHNHKLQLSYRDQENVKGKLVDERAVFLQWQYNY